VVETAVGKVQLTERVCGYSWKEKTSVGAGEGSYALLLEAQAVSEAEFAERKRVVEHTVQQRGISLVPF
jgi:hypothetical protein